MSLFGDNYKARKVLKIFDGAVMYFPKALAAVSVVSVAGNEQHNPGEPLHWARGKSMDQFNTCMRHLIEYRDGYLYAEDLPPEVLACLEGHPVRTLAQAAWRLLAALELAIEEEGGLIPPLYSSAPVSIKPTATVVREDPLHINLDGPLVGPLDPQGRPYMAQPGAADARAFDKSD